MRLRNQRERVNVPLWAVSKAGEVTARRSADFWRRGEGQNVECRLCFRRCVLQPGKAGWCRARVNAHGKMMLVAHGVLSCAERQMNGYLDPFMTYKPGSKSLYVGGVYCTSGCVFCASTDMTWRPDRIPWGYGGERQAGQTGGWFGYRAMLHPAGAVELALKWGCKGVLFGVNEPLMTWEYTFDTARLAKDAGLDVLIETNGFAMTEAVVKLAPYVDAVDLGLKGSGDPEFYARWMKAPAAMTAVFESLMAWRAAGVHLIVSDVVAPPQMQSEVAAAAAQGALFGWIAAHLGPLTECIITPMVRPALVRQGNSFVDSHFMLRGGASGMDLAEYWLRIERAIEIARDAGLVYAHTKNNDETIRCHACDGILLRFPSPMMDCEPCIMAKEFCPYWQHEEHVTGGKCDHCGAAVPVVTTR